GSDSGSSHTDNLTNVTTPLLTGTVSDLHGVDTVEIKDGSVSLGFATIAAGARSSTPTTPLAEGTHSLTAVATDNAGNVVSSSALGVIVDALAAFATRRSSDLGSDSGSSHTDNLTNVTTPLLTGTVSDLHGVDTVEIKDGSVSLGFATI